MKLWLFQILTPDSEIVEIVRESLIRSDSVVICKMQPLVEPERVEPSTVSFVGVGPARRGPTALLACSAGLEPASQASQGLCPVHWTTSTLTNNLQHAWEKMPSEGLPIKIDASFEDAVRFFARQGDVRREDSRAEESGSTREDDPASDPSEERTSPRR